MKTNPQSVKLSGTWNEELRKITKKITDLISAEKIVCYGHKIHSFTIESCFKPQREPEKVLNAYYLLVVPADDEKRSDLALQQLTQGECKSIADVTVIVHRMAEVNEALQNGSSFFTTIYKKGALLYDKEQVPFASPEEGKNRESRITRREKFWDKWHGLAVGFIKGARFYVSEQNNRLAVFMLHQALQHCYSGMLRVISGYRTNSNSLQRLINLIESTTSANFHILTKNTPEEARLTGLLMKGFSDARYNEKFEASNAEVNMLVEKVSSILDRADTECRQRLKEIREGVVLYTTNG